MPAMEKLDSIFSFFKDIWHFVYTFKPAYLSRHPTYNFIDMHGAWIMGNALLASGLLMIGTKMAYIDALFFASGASTQSGLNTVDVNTLNTWQQIVLYLFPLWTNPIIINTFVVILRGFWFQKRMAAVVEAATKSRRTIVRTFSRARTRDVADEERGIDGRRIVVMHNESRPDTGMTKEAPNDYELSVIQTEDAKENENAPSSSSSSSAQSGQAKNSTSDTASDHGHPLRPQITFADQVEGDTFMLKRQKNRDPDEVLRIPNPRDAEKGMTPRALEEMDQLQRTASRRASIYSRASAPEQGGLTEVPTVPRRGITIAEPLRHATTEQVPDDAKSTSNSGLGFLRMRRPNWTRLSSKKGGDDSENGAELHPIRSRISTFASHFKSKNDPGMPYLSWDPTIGRNSAFVDLTEDQREELGGIEYRSLKTLTIILIAYFLGFTLFGIVGLLPYIMVNDRYGRDVVNAAGAGRPWWAVYTSSSAFNDVGFTLTPDSMVSFKTAKWPQVLMSYLIIIGNTGFPIMLRVLIWMLSKIVPKDTSLWEELKFLLDHPRRCFTLLFPSKETWTLFWILCGLNGLDLILYVVLDLNSEAVTSVPVNIRVLNGWFQAVSTRTAGFAVIDLSALHPSVQLSYLIMMYISIFPIAISVRRTNVYEEKSLGVYQDPNEETDGRASYIGSHLRRQLSYDLWYIFLGFFIISIIEGQKLGDDSLPRFNMFALLFEIVSAYGTVGLSLGYPDFNTSFSGQLKTGSKLIIVAMQIRGRHRGLPYSLDRAIILPSEKRLIAEAEEATARAQRRSSGISRSPSVGGPLQRYRTRSTERPSYNLIGSFLGPGPAMPVHRRTTTRDESRNPRPDRRRHSVGTTGQRKRRESVDPSGAPLHQFFTNIFSGNNGTVEAQPGQKPEGRRHFYQEGVNPGPKSNADIAAAAKEGEGKQA